MADSKAKNEMFTSFSGKDVMVLINKDHSITAGILPCHLTDWVWNNSADMPAFCRAQDARGKSKAAKIKGRVPTRQSLWGHGSATLCGSIAFHAQQQLVTFEISKACFRPVSHLHWHITFNTTNCSYTSAKAIPTNSRRCTPLAGHIICEALTRVMCSSFKTYTYLSLSQRAPASSPMRGKVVCWPVSIC